MLDGTAPDVPAPRVFSLPGPDGGGRATVVNVVSTLDVAGAGGIRAGGHDPRTEADEVHRIGSALVGFIWARIAFSRRGRR